MPKINHLIKTTPTMNMVIFNNNIFKDLTHSILINIKWTSILIILMARKDKDDYE